MKKTILSIAIALASVASVSAAPTCSVGTLADYIALGSEGCTIGDKLFSGFVYAGTAGGGATAVAASDIVVNPLVSATDPGILFSSGGWTAFNGQFVDSTIAFDVSVLDPSFSIVGAELTIAGGSLGVATGTVAETLVPPAVSMFADVNGTPHDSVSFGPRSTIHVLKDILVVAQAGSGLNFASISAVEQRFNQTPGGEVPEPGSMALMGTALVAVGMIYRKSRA